MLLVRLVYVSEIVESISDVDIQVILGQSLIRNRRLDITGMLAKSDGHFCQMLEGRKESLATIMKCVRRSSRHPAVRVMFQEPIKLRQFAQWSMGLVVGMTCPMR